MATLRKTKKAKSGARTTAKKTAPAARTKRRPSPPRRTRASANGNRQADTAPSSSGLTQKQQLEKERAVVAAELERLRAELLESPEMTGDEVDLNVYEREKTLGLVSAYSRRLEEIEATLRAAEQGKYGICERCGATIDPERLAIFPETRLCVRCKNEVEREAKRMLAR
jgi:RNA polymerase-binding transcription factor DksA